jgi:hypothetical protein
MAGSSAVSMEVEMSMKFSQGGWVEYDPHPRKESRQSCLSAFIGALAWVLTGLIFFGLVYFGYMLLLQPIFVQWGILIHALGGG